jgi:hypothetical protein
MAAKAPVTGRAKGGVARAKQLTAKQRKEIAKRSAATRWGGENLPPAICGSEDTPLRIADQALDCYVLEDGTRVLSQAGFLRALGRNLWAKPSHRSHSSQVGVSGVSDVRTWYGSQACDVVDDCERVSGARTDVV